MPMWLVRCQPVHVAHWGTYITTPVVSDQNAVESCPQKYAIFKAIRTWEDARRADAFPADLKKLLRDPAYDWHIEANPDGGWKLYQSLKGEAVKTYKYLLDKP